MRPGPRLAALSVLLLAGLALVLFFALRHEETPLESSLSPVFQLLGTPVKAADSLVGRVIPVDEMDERDLGKVIRAGYDATADPNDPDHIYFNELLDYVAESADKPFEYSGYVLEDPAPNAMALPGGVVLVTRGLLSTLRSEAELVAVLSHEVGHIEQGHCFGAVKFQLLASKVGSETLGALADMAVRILVSHSFSKTQENEADEYAWSRLAGSRYDPAAAGGAFAAMFAWIRAHPPGGAGPGRSSRADILRDYFSSHPPLEIREAKYRERAEAWWRGHADERRYLGRSNLADRKSLPGGADRPQEWTGMVAP